MTNMLLLIFGLILPLSACAWGEGGPPATAAANDPSGGAGDKGQVVSGAITTEPGSSDPRSSDAVGHSSEQSTEQSTENPPENPAADNLVGDAPATIAPVSSEDASKALLTISDVEKLTQTPRSLTAGYQDYRVTAITGRWPARWAPPRLRTSTAGLVCLSTSQAVSLA